MESTIRVEGTKIRVEYLDASETIHVSPENKKLGRVWNISFLPGATCSREARQTCRADCYAVGSMSFYRDAARAWAANTRAYYHLGARVFFQGLDEFLRRRRRPVDLFRFCVAGDAPSALFFREVSRLGERHPTTQFLIYTKQFEYLKIARETLGVSLPSNVHVILSVHPKGSLPPESLARKFPLAFLYDPKTPDPRIPGNAFVCPGARRTCRECQVCFGGLSPESPVVFPIHGRGRKTPSLRETIRAIEGGPARTSALYGCPKGW